jgi:hypothetical protein
VENAEEDTYEIEPYATLPRNNELDVDGDSFKIPLNYLRITKYDWNNNGELIPEVIDKLKITSTVEIKSKIDGEEHISDGEFQSTLKGVLTDVYYGNMPSVITLGTQTGTSNYYPMPGEEDYIKLFRYTRVSERNYIVRLQLSLEYKDRSLRYPLKCNLFVYYEL